MQPNLSQRPKLLRSGISRGLSSHEPVIDEKGGDYGAGLIRGMAIVTRGEALGHDLWIDDTFLAQVADAIKAAPNGIKGRFTHPGLSGDGLGKFTGRVKNARLDKDVVRADLHFSDAARDTPDGDLAGYLIKLAKSDPEAFGNSIAFAQDDAAERQFLEEHGAEWKTDPDFGRFLSREKFESPDPLNVSNFPHARLKVLRAVDAVDDPAANPNGLFHRGDEIAAEAEQLIAFSLGVSKERPQLVELDLDPDRVGGFIQRFLERHNLTLATKTKQEGAMPTPELTPEALALAAGHQLAAKKAPRAKDEDDKSQEQKDADKDEGEDEDDDQNRHEDEELAASATAALAKGGGKRKTGGAPSDEAATQEEYQETQDEVSEGAKADANEGTPVDSPSKKKKKGIGPLGDPSNNVGASAKPDGKAFLAAFGDKGGVWFAEGRTFEEAQRLHTADLKAENVRLAKENGELKAKNKVLRGESTPVSGGGETAPASPKDREAQRLSQNLGHALGRFAAGLQIPGRPSRN